MMYFIALGISIALSFIANIFFIAGMVGYSTDVDTFKAVPWLRIDEDNIDIYFGLQSYSTSSDTSTNGCTDCSIKYSDCSGSTCNSCDDDGKVAFAFLVVASFATACVIGFGTPMFVSYGYGKHIVTTFMSSLAAVSSLISLAVFMGDCYERLQDDLDDSGSSAELRWGPGSLVVILGVLVMWAVAVFHAASCCFSQGESNPPTQLQQSSMADSREIVL